MYETINSKIRLRIISLFLIALLLTSFAVGLHSYEQYNPDKEVLLESMNSDESVETIYYSGELTDYDRGSVEKLQDSDSVSTVMKNPPKDSVILSSTGESVGIVNDNGEVTKIYVEDNTSYGLMHILWLIFSTVLSVFYSVLHSYHFKEPLTSSLTILTIIVLFLI